MTEWWNTLSTAEKTFWIIAVISTTLFIIQFIMNIAGLGDHDGIDDSGFHDGVEEGGFSLFTIKNTITFFAVFSWAGLTGISLEWSFSATIIFAIALGLVVMTVIAWIFYKMSRMTETGTFRIDEAVGKIGTVYLPIPARQEGFGKIQVRAGGKLVELEAVTAEQETIPTSAPVKIEKVINGRYVQVSKDLKL